MSTVTPQELINGSTPISLYRPPAAAAGHRRLQEDPAIVGGLVVVQDALGHWSAIRTFAAQAAQRGYLVAVPHLYHRARSSTFEPAPVFETLDFEQIRPLMAALTGDGISEDVTAAAALLREQGATKVAITGFCMGGAITLFAAANLPVDAAVTYYGGGITEARWPGVETGLESARKLKAPWLGVYASLDKGNPPDVLDALDQARAQSQTPSSVFVVRGVDHAFSIGEGVFPAYAPQEAELAHNLGWDFFARSLS